MILQTAAKGRRSWASALVTQIRAAEHVFRGGSPSRVKYAGSNLMLRIAENPEIQTRSTARQLLPGVLVSLLNSRALCFTGMSRMKSDGCFLAEFPGVHHIRGNSK